MRDYGHVPNDLNVFASNGLPHLECCDWVILIRYSTGRIEKIEKGNKKTKNELRHKLTRKHISVVSRDHPTPPAGSVFGWCDGVKIRDTW